MKPLLTAIAWSWLGSARGGFINLFLRELGIAGVALNLQSPDGVVAVTALSYAPIPFLVIGGLLRNMDPALEDSARVHGGSPGFTLYAVTLGLVLPGVLASALLVFVQAIGMFSVPAVLGMPADFYVATTEIFRALNSFPQRFGEAAAWGLLLLAITSALIWLQRLLLGRHSFATVTGKAFRPRLLRLGWARHGLAALAWLYVLLALILPVLALLWAASIRFLTLEFRLMTLTAAHFRYVLLQYPKTFLAIANSVTLGVMTASAVLLLGFGVSWLLVRGRLPVKGYLEQVSMFPLSMPAMVFALGLLWVYVGFTLVPIYGTIWLMLLAYATHYLPVGVRAITGALRQLHPELEEAARVAGASWGKTLRWVTLPLARPSLAAAWTLLFVMAMQEVSSSILLYSSGSIVLSVAMFDLWEGGNAGDLAALGVIQLVVTFIIVSFLLRTHADEALS